eukprot:3938185-Rhodomonas_salina.2
MACIGRRADNTQMEAPSGQQKVSTTICLPMPCAVLTRFTCLASYTKSCCTDICSYAMSGTGCL